jgi:RNA polymerase sigma factor (sigma-70 family)
MNTAADIESLQRVASYLPFGLEDTEQVNKAFSRWRSNSCETAKQEVELWTYCYVRRYFLMKFARQSNGQVSDYDQLIAKVFRKIESKSGSVRDYSRYTGWVSIICKNAFINYLRESTTVALPDEAASMLEAESDVANGDAAQVYDALRSAIKRLPDSLRDSASLRFLAKRSYEEISQATGRPLPIVRSYVHKAVVRLRNDPALLSVREDIY